jgi:Spy/CpxP family protein refolding chaperone
MKRIPLFLLAGGLLLGALGFAAIQMTKPDREADRSELRLGEISRKQLPQRSRDRSTPELGRKGKSSISVSPSNEGEDPLEGYLEMLTDEDKARQGMALLIQGMGKDMRARMIDRSMNQLIERLGLDEAQQVEIAKLMEARGTALQELMVKKLQGKATDEDFAAFASLGSFGDQVGEYLDPDQQEIFSDLQGNQRVQAIEEATKRNTTTLASVTDLTDDQAAEAEAILQAQVERETPAEFTNDFERMVMTREEDLIEMEQARLEALEPVLTPEQLDAYGAAMEQQREQFLQVGGIGPGGGRGFRP